MANKRQLKQSINYIMSRLFAECVAASFYSSKSTPEEVDDILAAIVLMRSDFIARISHPEPGMAKKQYFKNLKEDFNKQIDEIFDQLSNLA